MTRFAPSNQHQPWSSLLWSHLAALLPCSTLGARMTWRWYGRGVCVCACVCDQIAQRVLCLRARIGPRHMCACDSVGVAGNSGSQTSSISSSAQGTDYWLITAHLSIDRHVLFVLCHRAIYMKLGATNWAVYFYKVRCFLRFRQSMPIDQTGRPV